MRIDKVYLVDKIMDGYNLIGEVEGQRLDKQQMACEKSSSTYQFKN